MTDFPTTVSLSFNAYSLRSVLPFRTISVATFKRDGATCELSPTAATFCRNSRRSFVSSITVSLILGAASLTAPFPAAWPSSSRDSETTIVCLPMPTESPGLSVTIFTRWPLTNVPFMLPKSSSINRPSSLNTRAW